MNVDRELIEQVRARRYYSQVGSERHRYWTYVLHGMIRRINNVSR